MSRVEEGEFINDRYAAMEDRISVRRVGGGGWGAPRPAFSRAEEAHACFGRAGRG